MVFRPSFLCIFEKFVQHLAKKRLHTTKNHKHRLKCMHNLCVKQKKPGAISNFRFFKILIFRFFQGCHCVVVTTHARDELETMIN